MGGHHPVSSPSALPHPVTASPLIGCACPRRMLMPGCTRSHRDRCCAAGGALSRFATQHGGPLPPPPPSAASQPAGGALRQRRSIFASAELAGAGSGALVTLLHSDTCTYPCWSRRCLLQVVRSASRNPALPWTCMWSFVPSAPLLRRCALQAASISVAGHQQLPAACTPRNTGTTAVAAAGWQLLLLCTPPIWTSTTILRYTYCIACSLCHIACPRRSLLHHDECLWPVTCCE